MTQQNKELEALIRAAREVAAYRGHDGRFVLFGGFADACHRLVHALAVYDEAQNVTAQGGTGTATRSVTCNPDE